MTQSHTPSPGQAWHTRFELLQRLGADKRSVLAVRRSPEYRALGLKDRLRVSFNPWGFFLDWLYYLYKGMWHKAAVIIGASFAFYTLMTVLDALAGGVIPATLFWLPTPIICTQIVNYDYYRKVEHNEMMWPGLPAFLARPSGAVGMALAGVGLYLAVSFSPIGVFA